MADNSPVTPATPSVRDRHAVPCPLALIVLALCGCARHQLPVAQCVDMDEHGHVIGKPWPARVSGQDGDDITCWTEDRPR